MARKKHSRAIFTAGLFIVVVVALAYAFWPRPLLVDIGTVARGPLTVTIDEEGRTQVHDSFIVSTPIAGRLLRVNVEPGDEVEKDKTVVARMLPSNPSLLDARTREQAETNVSSAEAALRVAQADVNRALADRDLAESNLARTQKLFDSQIASSAALERDKTMARLAQANLDTARATISMRVAQLNNASAQLISFDDKALASVLKLRPEDMIPITAPASGVILQVKQQSEITLPTGAPIVEIGDVTRDLEIVADLLSTDAVKTASGARVIIDNWGGDAPLEGKVARIAPWGFTKYSALGVEEQRVQVTIDFADPPEARAGLGHGFRVEVRIVVWHDEDALIVPSSALFREGEDWAIFVVTPEGRAERRVVTLAANNGVEAAIAEGVSEGAQIVLYPSAALTDGARVAQRGAEG
ncbi:efflux RND transporter periplasmic adaptor subunit [Rhodalgimonas zhirmunskyi]|uniref:HlyD family efflux transporter periplasmic adaptor subunit n=1 Tax=Rhodalgimonas zhirmunskyi TaxID=2964767 RepID=A0AAJ1U8U9_9RHOB|nr:HlyD family efflux transporter periplasmic adaptor subunit [Rhodoalgimonas zhirmunskyi]MDQ2094910.1 HlyD family efflux transporter periplasmic adaptor subunit [Rhodoalgimonas zhirmunskyi]